MPKGARYYLIDWCHLSWLHICVVTSPDWATHIEWDFCSIVLLTPWCDRAPTRRIEVTGESPLYRGYRAKGADLRSNISKPVYRRPVDRKIWPRQYWDGEATFRGWWYGGAYPVPLAPTSTSFPTNNRGWRSRKSYCWPCLPVWGRKPCPIDLIFGNVHPRSPKARVQWKTCQVPQAKAHHFQSITSFLS